MPRRLLIPLVALLVVVLGGGVIAFAASGGEDPAPPARTADVPGVVALARPVTPELLGSGPAAELDASYVEPGGARRVVATFRQLRTYSGRRVDRRCLVIGSEQEVRGTRRLGGNCLDRALGEPWMVGVGADSRGPVTISGIASSRVERLTVAGPGGTFEVPRSRGGAFVVSYGKRAAGRAVLSAQLQDGTTRFYRTEVPPTFTAPGSARASDPGGLPDWTATAGQAAGGPTCVAVRQDDAIRAATPVQRGGLFLSPVCGDLTRSPVVARTSQLSDAVPDRPGARSVVPDRVVVEGVVAGSVRSVTLVTPGGEQPLPLASAGRAFVAVLPGGIAVQALTLRVVLNDGRRLNYPRPSAVGEAAQQAQPPYVLPGVELGLPQGERGTARVRLRLSAPARTVAVRLLGRRIVLARTGTRGRGTAYAGAFRPEMLPRRLASRGRLQRLTVLSCEAVGQCSETLWRALVR